MSAERDRASEDGGGLTLPRGYADRVNYALDQGDDHWGEQLLDLPNGPTYRNVKPLLVPANHGGPTVADSPWYYLPLTYPAPDPHQWTEQRAFTLHVADGSELLSQWSDQRASQRVRFFVGPAGDELFGSVEARLRTPELRNGYLPILINRYTDAAGVAWERESFAVRLKPGGPLVSMVRFTVEKRDDNAPSRAHLRISVATDGVKHATAQDGQVRIGGKTILAYSGDADWTSPSLAYELDLTAGPVSVYLVVANEPSTLPGVHASRDLFERSREQVSEYWRDLLRSGSRIHLPEPYAADAMRNMLLNNLVMGFNLTVGNGYEKPSDTFAFVPEVRATVTSLGDYGYVDRYRANLEELLGRGQGSSFFTTWERGIKLQLAARYYLQTNDRSLILEHLDTFNSWLAEFARQRDADPHGLLAKTRYGSDIPQQVYGIHHQSEAWRGMRDLGVALRLIGRTDDANAFASEANELGAALRDAIEQSKTVLSDGTVFVPIGLLNGDDAEQPYEQLTDSTLGSYWNLTMPYALATGILPPHSPTATGLRKYMYQHGALFLGLTRFNLTGADPGICLTKHAPAWPAAPGYKSSGIDQQYGYSLMRFLADSRQANRLVLSFYGMLAQSFTPNTFVGGEGETLSPCRQLGEYYRSQYRPPLSPNNATFLKALRLMLLREDLDDGGMPTGLHIAPATPRLWLRDGQHIGVRHLPTSFGPISYRLTSHLDDGYVTARINPPPVEKGRARLDQVTLHLRVPAGHRLTAVTVDGRTVPFDSKSETVRLGDPQGTVTVRADYTATPVRSIAHAQVTTVQTERLVEPGEKIRLGAMVEALGGGNVRGTVDVAVPAGWKTPRGKLRFTVHSAGRFAWKRLRTKVVVPKQAEPGDYTVTFVARPHGGSAHTTTVHIRVAVPAAGAYADLVRQQHPVGYWRLDETDADEAVTDASGSGNAGAFRGRVRTSAPGAIADDPNAAVRLIDGYVEVPDSSSVSLTGPYTLEAWVKTVAGGQQGIIEKYDGGDCLPSHDGYALRLVEGNKLQAINISGDRSFNGEPAGRGVQQMEWHHLASVYNGTTLRTYLDGRLQSSTPVAKAPTDGSGSLKIGARGDDAATRFEGWLDEVAIYDTALSPAQIDAHYVKGALGDPDGHKSRERTPEHHRAATADTHLVPMYGAVATDQPRSADRTLARPAAVADDSAYAAQVLADEPVGYWRLGEESGTTAEDSSGSGNDGTYTGAVTLDRPGALAGAPDTAARLNGGYVAVPDSDSVSVTGPFTLEAWVKLDDVCRQYSLVEKYDTPAYNGYGLRVMPGGKLRAFTLAGEGQVGAVIGQTIVMPHEWHHVVVVYDGTAITLYLDGQQDGSTATDVDPTDGAAGLKLGARGDDTATRLSGALDEVAVYDHALSAQQVKQHYTIGTTP